AQIALQLVADLLLRRLGIALEHLIGRQDHPRRAETALQSVLFPEALLDRMQVAVFREPFDGRDLGAVGLDGKDGTRLHRLTVHQNRASAALARVAADVRARESHGLPAVMDEQEARLRLVALGLSVDRHLDW